MQSNDGRDKRPLILFIENQIFDMSIYLTILKEDYQFAIAYDVETAVDLLEKGGVANFDLIILDIMMPLLKDVLPKEFIDDRKTGIHLFNEYIAGKPEAGPIPVIILTGAPEDILDEINILKDEYPNQIINVLKKSEVNPAELKNVVDRVFMKDNN